MCILGPRTEGVTKRSRVYTASSIHAQGQGMVHVFAQTLACLSVNVQERGCDTYSTLNLKNSGLSSGANSRQMLPSTTDTESGFTLRGEGGREGCTGSAPSPRACSPRLGCDRSWKEMTLFLFHSCKSIRPVWRIAVLEPR